MMGVGKLMGNAKMQPIGAATDCAFFQDIRPTGVAFKKVVESS